MPQSDGADDAGDVLQSIERAKAEATRLTAETASRVANLQTVLQETGPLKVNGRKYQLRRVKAGGTTVGTFVQVSFTGRTSAPFNQVSPSTWTYNNVVVQGRTVFSAISRPDGAHTWNGLKWPWRAAKEGDQRTLAQDFPELMKAARAKLATPDASGLNAG